MMLPMHYIAIATFPRDTKTAQEILELLTRMNEQGKTVIVITHDPTTAAYAKRTIRLKDGLIVAE